MATLRLAIDARGARAGANEFSSAINQAKSSALNFTRQILALAGVTGIGYMIKQQMEAMHSTGELAKRIGVATESIVALQYAGKMTGIDQETLNFSIEMFSRKLGEASLGVDVTRKSITSLGLNYRDLIGIPIDDALGKVADKINALGSQSQKAAIIQDLFGRNSRQLMNLFEEGSAGLIKFRQETERLGISFSKIDSAQVDLAIKSMVRMRESIRGVFVTIMPEISPYIEAFGNSLTDFMTKGDGFANMINDKFYPSIKGIIYGLAYMQNGIIAIEASFKGLGGVMLGVSSLIVEAIGGIQDKFVSLNNTIAGTWAGRKAGFNIMPIGELSAWGKALEEEAVNLRNEAEQLLDSTLPTDKLEEYFTKLDKMLADSRGRASAAALGRTGGGTNTPGFIDDTEKTTRDISEAYSRMYEDMGKSGNGYYESQKKLIDLEYKEYDKFIKDKALLDEWYAAKLEKLAIDSSGFWQETKNALEGTQSALSDYFMEFGKLDDLTTSIAKSFQRMFANLASEMLMAGATAAIFGEEMSTAMGFKNPLGGMGKAGIGGLLGLLFGGGGAGGAVAPELAAGPHVMRAGGIFDRGNLIPFAAGDIFDRPSYFPMVRGQTGLMGENGPEAVMPLRRGPGGKLGIEAGNPNINLQPNFKLILVHNEREAYLEAMNSAEGEKVIVRHVARNRRTLG